MQNNIGIDQKKTLSKITRFLVPLCLAYSIARYVVAQNPAALLFILILVALLTVVLRWNILSIPIVFILYSGYFGNFANLPRLNILGAGLYFHEVVVLFCLVFFLFREKGRILRTPVAKAVSLLLVSAMVSVTFTYFDYGVGLRTLLMNQRAVFLYFSVFLFLGVMKNNKSFYHTNYIFLSLASIFILLNVLCSVFPNVQELRAYPIGGVSSYIGLRAVEEFGARRFMLPSEGVVYYGLSFFFFLVTLKPFRKFAVLPSILFLSGFMALVLSYTRGLWICVPLAIIITTACIGMTRQLGYLKVSRLFIIMCSITITIAVFFSAYPSHYKAVVVRMWQMKVAIVERTGTWESRLLEATSALHILRESPVLGGGNFIYRKYGPTIGPGVHFGFVDIYLNYGLLGLFSFFLFFYIPIKQFIKNAHKISDKVDFWIASSSICYVLIFMIVSSYSSQFFHHCWVLSFCFCLANLAFLDRKYNDSK